MMTVPGMPAPGTGGARRGGPQGDQIVALLGPQGTQLLNRLSEYDPRAAASPQFVAELRRDYPPDLVSAALTQHELRVAARVKFTEAEQMLFTRDGLEQASAEVTARHRAVRYTGASRVADLCCGIGGDLLALAADRTGPAAGRTVLAVDRDGRHLRMALHNAGVYQTGGRIVAVQADVRDICLDGIDAVFIDPARRAGGRRFRAGQSEPSLAWCTGLAERVPAIGVKAAPGLPHDVIPAGWEAEFVAIGRDLKEATLWSPALATAPRRATILPEQHTLLPRSGPEVPVAPPGAFVFDPNPAVTRAGLVEDLARQLDAWKIDPQIAFLSADHPRQTPFARTLRVLESAPWHEKRFAQQLRELGIGAVDIRRRGLAGDVEQIRRRLKLRGSARAMVLITRVHDRPWGLICTTEF